MSTSISLLCGRCECELVEAEYLAGAEQCGQCLDDEQQEQRLIEVLETWGVDGVLRAVRDYCAERVGPRWTEREWLLSQVTDDLDAALMSASKLEGVG